VVKNATDDLEIDFINYVVGVGDRIIVSRSIVLTIPATQDHGAISLRVMHPMHCLQSRAANILHPLINRDNQIAQWQYRVAVDVAGCWIERALRHAEHREATKSLTMLATFLANSAIGRRLHERLAPDPLELLKQFAADLRLDKRYRKMTLCRQIERIEHIRLRTRT
jgi:hypothetical protein